MKVMIKRGNGYEQRTCEVRGVDNGVVLLFWDNGPGNQVLMPFSLVNTMRSRKLPQKAGGTQDPRQLSIFHLADIPVAEVDPEVRWYGRAAGQGMEEFGDWFIDGKDFAAMVATFAANGEAKTA